jgi:hypothetical protein
VQKRPEERYDVDFLVSLSWQEKNGALHRVSGRCINLSPSGAKLEMQTRLDTNTIVLAHSEQFGRMGDASIRYCRRDGMKYSVGLKFRTAFGMGDPVRNKILSTVLRADAGRDSSPPVY